MPHALAIGGFGAGTSAACATGPTPAPSPSAKPVSATSVKTTERATKRPRVPMNEASHQTKRQSRGVARDCIPHQNFDFDRHSCVSQPSVIEPMFLRPDESEPV